jgi:hypothetical protein
VSLVAVVESSQFTARQGTSPGAYGGHKRTPKIMMNYDQREQVIEPLLKLTELTDKHSDDLIKRTN